MTNIRVLFVDDETAILDGLRNQFRRERTRWDMRFASSGRAALELMQACPADVVISDMRMPNMDGAQLLTRIKRDYPGTARIVLSGHAEREAVIRALPVTHQYVSKPCEPDALRAIIDRTHLLQSLLCNPPLTEVVGDIDRLPSVPGIYAELVRLAAEPSTTIGAIAAVVERDASVSAKVLQLVNSAFFGLAHRVVGVRDAVSFLGVEIIKGLVLGSSAFYNISLSGAHRALVTDIQMRSTLTGTLARQIVGDRALAGAAFTSGLLHDVGKIVLLTTSPAVVECAERAASESGKPRHEAERDALGVSHAEVGAYLLALWGIPFPIVEAVAFHHRPSDIGDGEKQLVQAVHVADALIDEALDEREAVFDAAVLAGSGGEAALGRLRGIAAGLVRSTQETREEQTS